MIQRFIKTLVLGFIRVYRVCFSRLKPPCCRFEPTCSSYALNAVNRFGVLRGVWLSLKRLLRCHPFYCGDLYDPVPEKNMNRLELNREEI